MLKTSTLSPDEILTINNSCAKDIASWREVLRFGDIVSVESCADARLPVGAMFGKLHQADQPIALVGIHSIAASEKRTGYNDRFLNLNRLRAAATITHFSQRKKGKGISPGGCGGLEAKRTIDKNNAPQEGILHYVNTNIVVGDPIIQALVEASARSQQLKGIPVLAATASNETLELLPLAIFKNGKVVISAVPDFQKYIENPEKIGELYDNKKGEFPSLTIDDVGNEDNLLYNLLAANQAQVVQLKKQLPDLAETQQIQDPKIICAYTSLVPLSVMLDGLCGMPNSAFKIGIASRHNKGAISVTPAIVKSTIEQMLYPLGNHVQAAQGGGHGFAHTVNGLVLTYEEDYKTIIEKLKQQPVMQKWLELGGNLMGGRSQKGVIEEIERFG